MDAAGEDERVAIKVPKFLKLAVLSSHGTKIASTQICLKRSTFICYVTSLSPGTCSPSVLTVEVPSYYFCTLRLKSKEIALQSRSHCPVIAIPSRPQRAYIPPTSRTNRFPIALTSRPAHPSRWNVPWLALFLPYPAFEAPFRRMAGGEGWELEFALGGTFFYY